MPLPRLVAAGCAFACSLALALPLAAQIAPTLEDVAYGPHERNRLDFWRADGDGDRPLLVFVHGGGWVVGDKKNDRKFCAPFLAAGVHCASVNYRRTDTDPLPAPVLDAARALQFLRSKAGEWHIDKAHVAVMGGSAGGCTAAWLLLHDDLADSKADDPVLRESTRICAAWGNVAQTSIDPKQLEAWVGPHILEHRMIWRAVGAPDMATALRDYDRHAALYREYSPITHLDRDDPPLFLTYGGDRTLPAKDSGHAIHHAQLGEELQRRAREVGQRCELRVGVPHQDDEARAFLLAQLLPQPAAADAAASAADKPTDKCTGR